MNTVVLLKLAALTHLGLVTAAALMPFVTKLWTDTEKLMPFGRALFRTYYTFIGLCLVSFGLGTWIFAAELAADTRLARAVCGFLTAFWMLRLIAAIWLLDLRPYLTNLGWRVGYHATNVVFSLLPFLYGWLALRPATAT